MTLYCNNINTINISKNLVQHSLTKHIDIRHHFIRELVGSKVIALEHVQTDKQLTDIFIKPLDFNRFVLLRDALGLCIIQLFQIWKVGLLGHETPWPKVIFRILVINITYLPSLMTVGFSNTQTVCNVLQFPSLLLLCPILLKVLLKTVFFRLVSRLLKVFQW